MQTKGIVVECGPLNSVQICISGKYYKKNFAV